ncbi:hypothetical protein [Arenibacter sp. S6351L]|uniref:poly(ethylene terephthalate) hydrolase family protein n=1 Tax=Arenibacter sp. S6351L TaxID=2926407 RepID=UPI001FF66475|nr:hypothetical protein [Arenibacter sp. S6351L]MCK0137093.1 hypothetical protein [Arenibacter sp. S6351L]
MIFKQIESFVKNLRPTKLEIHGAIYALYVSTALLVLLSAISAVFAYNDPWILLNYLARITAIFIFTFVLLRLTHPIYSFSKRYLSAILITIPIFLKVFYFELRSTIFIVVVLSLLGAGLSNLWKPGFRSLRLKKQIIVLIILTFGLSISIATLVLYSIRGLEMDPIFNAAASSQENVVQINASSPAENGSHTVKYLSYGSGKDKHRPAFGMETNIITPTINGTAFMEEWTGFGGWFRKKYWGFNISALPLNAHVWYPEGRGPFPLVLIVHGDHDMKDFSENGYAYLGDLLASRGFILVSVAQNFLNYSWSDYRGRIKNDNNARALLLLEHLKIWHTWNAKENHLFFKKVDTTNVALIGHSKGGESVVHAALMNHLMQHPDDENLKLDYNYSIKSLVGLAPVDGNYKPGGEKSSLQDINYLTIHGSLDGEVPSFLGAKQFERITFSDSAYYFKSGLYIKGANHGQFNTTWGENDAFSPFYKGFLNLADLIPAEEQRNITKVYLSAFLETTLKDNKTFLPLFADYRKGRNWLPNTIYLNQFEDSRTNFICTFDEDADLTSSALSKNAISSENLTIWQEREIYLKNELKGSRGVFVGWEHSCLNSSSKGRAGEQTELFEFGDLKEQNPADCPVPQYSIQIPPEKICVDSSSILVFSMAEASGDYAKLSKKKSNSDNYDVNTLINGKDLKHTYHNKKTNTKTPINFSINIKDSIGTKVSFHLSDFSGLQREIQTSLSKMDHMEGKFESEKVFQLFAFPVKDMLEKNPGFDPTGITSIHFVFDDSKKGLIIIDNIGFMQALDE